ncbi:aldose 1-epimerase family protein [Leifsonia sp. F6_8S_P_1B]|uniref:Aldose 1-epimerase family protein n=1 Tax=Leifsonia williamsii TaxID=3035919 RepID=A0ABT8K9M1_9MICO|nr:aldose 1-epimerase family protein [Leifsonia williamsii]MDN4614160.1 aldose 1-epimerase family protein [Leifsonia williamsii]
MSTPISGTHFGLTAGDYHATIASVGASLRTLEHRGRPLVVPFDADEVRPAYRGATLAPWPNRVVDGRYTFAGVEQQLPLTEPNRGHALHGLVSWLDFAAVDRSGDSATFAATIEAQAGYPHRVEVTVAFRLDEQGLHTTVTGTNTGPTAAPWGTGPHPYLVAGDGRVDDWTLSLPASQVLTVTEDRLIPTGLVPVTEEGGVFDFRTPRVIGDTFIDHAFTGLRRGEEGEAVVRLTTTDGSGVEVSWDSSCPWVQVHTADQPDPASSRLGLAVEPMTCPPDAYNSGTDLIVLEPGASASASWTIRAV